MNKVLTIALIAGGLLLLDSPEAAAHKEVRIQHHSQARHHSDHHGHESYRRGHRRHDYHRHYNDRYDYYSHNYRGTKYRRARHMPRWLQRERSFIRWYDHSPLRRNRYIAWHVLFDIYRAEHRYQRRHRY